MTEKKVKIQSTEATEDDSIEFNQNIAGAPSVVLEKEVQAPYDYVLINTFALRAELEDSSGTRLREGDITLAVAPPDSKDRREVDDKDLRTYSDLTASEQRQDDFAGQVGYEVESGELVVPTDHRILVLVDSQTQLDTAESYIELEARREN